ncbi:hypothetical protein K431DRAFT_300444 [Polychaeton citri CBS 116435]|uniref:Calcium permease n=1 Tax=Polychaeton citri CBS 116435 TaxID=1314669 RepID=A0A9P4UUD3_9PEZI|nr:hypothetical protein K431DRAFT_300444 [Polychaeton citri CBS 116435]
MADLPSRPGSGAAAQRDLSSSGTLPTPSTTARQDYGSLSANPISQPQSQPSLNRRPSTIKRSSSSKAPYRGQAFSVDDDVQEVNEDKKAERRAQREQEQRQWRRESTLRRRPTAQLPSLPRVSSSEQEEEEEGDAPAAFATASGHDLSRRASVAPNDGEPSSEETLHDEEEEEAEAELEEEAEEDEDEEEVDGDSPATGDDDPDTSDAESFTLKDRQQAINETHPFGIRIWKPALYKKSRSVQRNAEGDIHSAPGGNVSRWLFLFNCLWTVIFGWWLSLVALSGGLLCCLFALFQFPGCRQYGKVLVSLAGYLFYPFGKYVKLEHDEAYMDEDEGEGRTTGDYERWQTGELEEGRLFFGPTDINRSLIGRRRDSFETPSETDSLLGRQRRPSPDDSDSDAGGRRQLKKRLFGRGKWNAGRVIFFLSFYFMLTPLLFFVSGICWFLVFTIPMGKVTLLVFYHVRRHPLALSFHNDAHYSRADPDAPGSSILLCTYRAVGLKYWKYTIDGTNIFLINLLGLVVFTIFDYFVLSETLHIDIWLTSNGLVFILGLASIIPLAYFIGQAVASISAQSSMGVGATVNAFFSTVVEVFLYCVALGQGKAQLVEGSIIGSVFAGILFLPGLSMCFGALKRKTQRFNVKSAGVTSTMLLFSVIAGFGPTLFYQIYGSHELNCLQCVPESDEPSPDERDCRRCYFSQLPAANDQFFLNAVRPYTWFAAVLLFLSYVIGLLFTLRTHAAVIWNDLPDEKKEMIKAEQAHKLQSREHHGSSSATHASIPGISSLISGDDTNATPLAHSAILTRQNTSQTGVSGKQSNDDIRGSLMYRRILHQSLKQAGIDPKSLEPKSKLDGAEDGAARGDGPTPHLIPPKSSDKSAQQPLLAGLSVEDNRTLIQQVAEMAATAATVAAKDATTPTRRYHHRAPTGSKPKVDLPKESTDTRPSQPRRASALESSALGDSSNVHDQQPATATTATPSAPAPDAGGHSSGGHDAPNWSRTKSSVILLTATVAYAVIAEILVDTVDAVLSNVSIDQKFLGITLFALVPNTTEFLNAISFAMNGNIALSMEIGSAYALQVILLQIPALVLFSAIYGQFLGPEEIVDHTFSLIFPQWDMVTVILSVFLMGYVLGEGKSNYFKGSSLILTYLVIIMGFWFSGYDDTDLLGANRFETHALGPRVETYRTIGRGRSGRAY